jgi:hypothetical protein
MQVCVCGWYFNEKCLDVLKDITSQFPVTIIAHKDKLPKKYHGHFEYIVRKNRGLEYGAYDHFLKNAWKGDDVLFMHDDIEISPILDDWKIAPPGDIFEVVSKFKDDFVYIFKNETSWRECFGVHGRAMFASKRFLKRLLDSGGFPYDKHNDGYTMGENPGYCEHYNWPTAKLKEICDKFFDYEIGHVFIPAFDYYIRGKKK